MKQVKHTAAVETSGIVEEKRDALAPVMISFEGNGLTFHVFRGRPCVVGAEFGRAMGYSDDGSGLNKQVTDEWSTEFARGHHFDVLTGQALRDFKAIAALGGQNPLSQNTRNLTVLYEPGFDLAALLTKQPLGKKLRAFVVANVLPKLRRGEPVLPAPTATDGIALRAIIREEVLAALRSAASPVQLSGKIGTPGASGVKARIERIADVWVAAGRSKSLRSARGTITQTLRGAPGVTFGGTGSAWSDLPKSQELALEKVLTTMEQDAKAWARVLGAATQGELFEARRKRKAGAVSRPVH